ncbi:MAG: class I SAM-dependent methyltransferase [Chloroflexi bacterium]|nr:class I SAM-dependent methyltransferase [Chloroflexota bacterium]
MPNPEPDVAAALARLYDLDLSVDPGDVDLYLALAARTGGPIVELCAGSGRIAIPLAAAGHEVTGVDRDEAMLARADIRAGWEPSEVAARITMIEGDLFGAAVPGAGTFRLGIIGLNSLLVLGGPPRQRAAFAVLAGLLAPGGVAVVDTWLPLADDLARFDGRLGLEWVRGEPSSGQDVMKLVAAWYDSASRVVTLTTIFDEGRPGEAPRRWIREDALHLVAADELRMYAEDAGLEIEVVAGDHDLSPLRAGDERAIVVARRPGGP